VTDGIDRVVGQRHPGDIIGEVPITLATGFPVDFRAAERSRMVRIAPADYHAIVAVAPEVAEEVGKLASYRIGGPGGLQGLAADPPPPRAIVVGDRWDPSFAELRHFLDRNQISFKALTSDAPDAPEQWGGVLPAKVTFPVTGTSGSFCPLQPQQEMPTKDAATNSR
jgi:thioredoxin reductase (NADPH)